MALSGNFIGSMSRIPSENRFTAKPYQNGPVPGNSISSKVLPQHSPPFADKYSMSALGSALGIIQRASASVDQTASRLARPVDVSGNGDIVDLSAEMIALLQAKNATAVGVKIAQTVDDLQQSTLSVLG